jgi:hypothetical protein
MTLNFIGQRGYRQEVDQVGREDFSLVIRKL